HSSYSSFDRRTYMHDSVAFTRQHPIRGSHLKPPLKWAGGKRWQVPYLRSLWEPHSQRRLVEPFSGGLAVAMGLMPGRALLNDINPHLINFYSWLRRGLQTAVLMRNSKTL